MSKILSRILNVLKYLLLVVAFMFILYGIMATYKRLEKNILDAIPVFLPFFLVFVIFIVNIFVKKNVIRDNLLFNFVAVMIFIGIIIVGYRAKFDTNMLIYYKYNIKYNPLYLSDNLSMIKISLYVLFASNLLLLISTFFDKKQMKVID